MSADHVRPSPLRFLVLGWCCAAAIVAYLQRTAIGVAVPEIRAELALSTSAMGAVMSGYYWAYALSQVPAGWITQRWGPRLMLVACLAGSSLCTMAAAISPGGAAFAVSWLLAGVMIAGIFPACVQLFVAWFPSHARGTPSGLLGSSMSVGGALSSALTGWLLVNLPEAELTPWRLVFLGFGLPGILWAVSYGAWSALPAARPQPNFSVVPEPTAETPASTSGWEGLLDYRIALVCGQQFFRAAGYVFYNTWFATFLRETRGVDTAQAGWLTSLPLWGVVVGSAAGGLIADALEWATGSRRLSRQGLGIGSQAACGLLILAAQPIADARLATLVVTLGSTAFALGSSSAYAITMDLGGRRTASLFALMNMCGNIGAAVSPLAVGVLVTYFGWSPILAAFAGLYFASALCWVGLNPESRGAAT